MHSELAGSPKAQRPVLPGKPLPSKGSRQREDSGVEGPDPTCLLSTETGPAMPREGALLIEFLRGSQDWWGGKGSAWGSKSLLFLVLSRKHLSHFLFPVSTGPTSASLAFGGVQRIYAFPLPSHFLPVSCPLE